jgi:branched-chain amino acid transport system permease protein
MTFTVLNVIIQGVMLGGLYALFALGLSISVGVVKLVNIAHGDLIILMSFTLFYFTQILGMPLWLALLVALPLSFGVGYVLQAGFLSRVMNKGQLAPLLVTFGLSVIIQNALLEGFGADTRAIPGGALQTATLQLSDKLYVGALPALTLLAAVGLILVADLVIFRTSFGARLRAVADNAATARLIGLPVNVIYAMSLGLVGITICVAALFLALRMNFDPLSGPSRLIIAFEVIVLGGLGNLWGLLVGGTILGLAQSVGAEFDIRLQLLAGHLVFLLVLMIRPEGIFRQR